MDVRRVEKRSNKRVQPDVFSLEQYSIGSMEEEIPTAASKRNSYKRQVLSPHVYLLRPVDEVVLQRQVVSLDDTARLVSRCPAPAVPSTMER